MSDLAKLDAARRRAILRLISEGGDCSETVILDTLSRSAHGYRLTRTKVRADLDWLRDRHLIGVEMLGDTLMVASATATGEEVLGGRRRVDGVAAPKRRDL